MSCLSELLKSFNQNRLPEMVNLKYEAMTENPFRFYRGTCHLFYHHLCKQTNFPDSPPAWICGDLHLENFGSYKADNKLVYFDLNDFDEAILAPALWEVARVVTSIFIAFDTLQIDPSQGMNMACMFVKTYANTLAKGKAISIDPRTSKGIVCQFLKSADKSKYIDLLDKRTTTKKNKIILSLEDERHFKLEKTLKSALKSHITEWIKSSNDSPYNYEVMDAVFRLAGTGSIGVKRYLILLKSTNKKDRYLIVDMKQSFPSSLSPYLSVKQPDWETDATRILSIQQRMQNVSASLLSTTVFNGEPYVIQELQPVKDTIKFKLIKDHYRDMYEVIYDMAILTASSQLRSGGMDGSAIIDDLKKLGDNEEWQQTLLDYTKDYAEKVKNDYLQYVREFKEGVYETKQ